MSFDLTVLPDRNLAYFRIRGDTAIAEGAQAFRDYVDHPLFDPNYTMLTSASEVGDISASFTGIVMAVERLLPVFGSFHAPAHSIIHAPGDVAFGLARMIQQLTEPLSGIRYTITRNESEALQLAGQRERTMLQLNQHLAAAAGLPAKPAPGMKVQSRIR